MNKTFFNILLVLAGAIVTFVCLVAIVANAATPVTQVFNGGTGKSTFTSSQLLYGNSTNPISTIATTSITLGLGLSTSGTLGALVGGSSGTLSIATSSLYTGTTGQVPYFSGTNTLIGTSTLFITSIGQVGIATTSPGQSSKLGVDGGGFFNGTLYGTNFVDTAVTGNNCIGETNGLLGTSNCVASVASAGSTLTVSSPTGNVDVSINLAHANTYTGGQTFGNSTTTGTVAIPSGAAVITPQAGNIAIDTTSGQLRYSDGTTRVFPGYFTMSFGYSTTTWTGTTTLYLAPAAANITVGSVRCETSVGTVGVSLYDASSNRADYIPTASTTINTFTYTTNNTFTSGESMRLDVGTPASSPTFIACRFKATYDAD